MTDALKLTNLDKLYWKGDKITKGDMLRYYKSVSRYILPYLRNRPVMLRRFPDGINGLNFYQKNAGENAPNFVKTAKVQHEGRKISYIIVQDVKSLLYVANLGSIELHTFNASLKRLEKPDYMVFDLDPQGVSYDAVVDTAKALHEIFQELRMPSFCKTSGATGMHIYVPMHGQYDFKEVKHFASLIARLGKQRLPGITSIERNPQKRKKKVYIDCLQNEHMQTLVCPYSLRARPHAPVSTPLDWKEVKHGLDPAQFTIKNTMKRLSNKGDIFRKVLGKGISLERCVKSLEKLF